LTHNPQQDDATQTRRIKCQVHTVISKIIFHLEVSFYKHREKFKISEL